MADLPRVGNAIQAANRRRLQELESRRQARVILNPVEVAGKYSAARMLTTTLGGQVRPITPQDLAAFRKAVANLGKKVSQGITAAEALGLSRPADVQRAREEIRYSMVVRLQAGKLQLVTNASAQSRVNRHHVTVEFVQYSAALARPGKPLGAAMWLVKETPLRFECDCEHFRYFLRYVASAGGWVAGRVEHGYPKLKNPMLAGACCKHLVRVMTDLQQSGGIRQRIANMIEADRQRIDAPGKARPKVFTVSQQEAEGMLPKRARTIRVQPYQRRATLTPKATAADIRLAMAVYAGKTDAASQAITRALAALAAQQTRP
ncbi:hypothetical protein [Xenophilus azovorans]|uniref:hypothetical protein n=1 Tax=Xenophilus azovorans TaxID=151755 RepID=UPI00056F9127|nr:hypothetical protein [Xenophilus azovorans]